MSSITITEWKIAPIGSGNTYQDSSDARMASTQREDSARAECWTVV